MGCGCKKQRHHQTPVVIDNGLSEIPNVTRIRCSSQAVTNDDCGCKEVRPVAVQGCYKEEHCPNRCGCRRNCGCGCGFGGFGFGGFGLF